ncbi:FAD-binding oxidoreductase [Rhodoferax sp.]|uniref:FAD-binding oxidoreductase n=1 Tax=Rhodoferax sp. TaxID=50421 RepID=UPI00263263A3|nr:FAD-binding oxidoreductase [Rhodoferax sp.]MDD3937136.1 FAD-binding oxidoreductase [Rhodoferax sp.]
MTSHLTSPADSTPTAPTAPVVVALQRELGATEVLTGDRISPKYLKDWSDERGGTPLALVRPRNTQQVAQVLRICHAHGQAVTPQGGLTGLAGGAVPSQGSVVLSLERMSGITAIDTGSATMTVLAGTPLQVIQEAAQQAGFIYALDLGARGSCQIGGNLSTNAGGNRVIRYGMARELVLGLEVVLADGTVLSMLNQMVKNNAGPDLKHLFIGSEGTLGVITQAVLRLHPGVSGANTALVALTDFDAVVQFLRHAQQSLSGQVSAFEVMWPDFYRAAIAVPGTRAPLPAHHPVYVLLDMQGATPETEAARFQAMLEEAMAQGWVVDAAIAQSHAETQDFWALRDSVSEMLQVNAPTINFDLSVPISRIGNCVEQLMAVMTARFAHLKVVFFGHVGDGNIHAVVGPIPQDGVTEHQVEEAFYAIIRDFSGSVSAEHGIGLHKKQWLGHSRSPAEMALMKVLKNAMDPSNILNPGKIL